MQVRSPLPDMLGRVQATSQSRAAAQLAELQARCTATSAALEAERRGAADTSASLAKAQADLEQARAEAARLASDLAASASQADKERGLSDEERRRAYQQVGGRIPVCPARGGTYTVFACGCVQGTSCGGSATQVHVTAPARSIAQTFVDL